MNQTLSPRAKRWSWATVLLCGGAIVASFFLPPGGASDEVMCLFKRTTGLPCIGCGLTRAFIAVGHGRFADAFAYNPITVLLYPGFIIAAVLASLRLAGKYRPAERPDSPPWVYAGFVLLVVVLWVARMINSSV